MIVLFDFKDQQSKSIHDELIDGGLFGKKTLSCERTAKAKQQADEEWLETIKKLSFECQANLKRENSATKQQLETNVPKFTQGGRLVSLHFFFVVDFLAKILIHIIY